MGTKGTLSVIAALILMAAGAYVWFGAPGGFADTMGQAATGSDPASNLRLTLDPDLFKGEVREAYQIARRDPGLLAQLHCCRSHNNNEAARAGRGFAALSGKPRAPRP